VNGHPVHFDGPQDARAVGIETVYQDLALAPDLDAAANVFLGRELLKPWLLGRLGVWQQVAVGAVLIGAVYFDQLRRKLRNR
jgi:simple sugar transport system ATP-binding protein